MVLHNQMIDFRTRLSGEESWDQRLVADDKEETLLAAVQKFIHTVWLQVV